MPRVCGMEVMAGKRVRDMEEAAGFVKGCTELLIEFPSTLVGDDGAMAVEIIMNANTHFNPDNALTKLGLPSNKIGNVGANYLGGILMQNKVLRTMLLDVNLIGDSGAMSIAQALEHNTALVKLDLWDNKIGDKGAVSLARALEKNTVLTTLDLGINKITDTGATAIAAALQVNTVVTELKLEGNTGIDEGIVASIEASLAENRDPVKREAKIKAAKEIVKARATALTTQAAGEGRMCGRPEFITHRNIPPDCKELDMSYNQELLQGHTRIAKGLRDMFLISIAVRSVDKLKRLVLHHNQMSDSDAADIADVLKVSTTIEVVDLSNNNIGDKGAVAIANMLRVNTALTTLALDENEIGDVGLAAIAEALKVNTALKVLEIGSNRITSTGATAIAEALKTNTGLVSFGMNSLDGTGNDIIASSPVLLSIEESLRENRIPQQQAAKAKWLEDTNATKKIAIKVAGVCVVLGISWLTRAYSLVIY